MSDYLREIADALGILSQRTATIPVIIFDATIVSVDKSTRTCIVNSEKNNIDNLQVRLMPEVSDGTLDLPSVDSTVIVLISGITDPIIVSKSWIDEKTIIVDKQGYKNDGKKQVFNDGGFGGLAKIIELTSKLNKIEDDLNVIKSAISGWTPVSNDGGAALKIALASWYSSSITKTVRGDIENKSITHGESL